MPPTHEPATEPGLQSSIRTVGGGLARAFEDLVAALPGSPVRPQDVARTLGVDKNAAHRMMTAIRQKDPLATVYHMPGPRPLRRLVEAGRAKAVSVEVVESATSAVAAFDELIQREGGDRSSIDLIITDCLPDLRPSFENVAKQLMYRGARQIRGIAADAVLYTVFLHPSTEPSLLSFTQLQAYIGLRRVRPSAELKLRMLSSFKDPEVGVYTLEGKPVHDLEGVILREFCSSPDVKLDVHTMGRHVIYALGWGDSLGHHSARDIVMADHRPQGLRRFRLPDDPLPRSGVTDTIKVPTRTYIADLIMHTDAYPDWEAKVRVLETGAQGAADPNDPTRDFDVLDLTAHVTPLGSDINRFHAPEVPQYARMIHHVCEKLGWDPASFRGYRTRIDYPIFGSQIQFAFDLPVGP